MIKHHRILQLKCQYEITDLCLDSGSVFTLVVLFRLPSFVTSCSYFIDLLLISMFCLVVMSIFNQDTTLIIFYIETVFILLSLFRFICYTPYFPHELITTLCMISLPSSYNIVEFLSCTLTKWLSLCKDLFYNSFVCFWIFKIWWNLEWVLWFLYLTLKDVSFCEITL